MALLNKVAYFTFRHVPLRWIKPTMVGPFSRPYITGSEVVLPLNLAKIFVDECLVLEWYTAGVEFALGRLVQLGFHHYEGADRPCSSRVFVHLLGRRFGKDYGERRWNYSVSA